MWNVFPDSDLVRGEMPHSMSMCCLHWQEDGAAVIAMVDVVVMLNMIGEFIDSRHLVEMGWNN